jgi:GT2 family glycosyltransferase
LLAKNLPTVLAACEFWAKTGWEIIVVDDASTDDSVDFLKNKYPRIKIVRHKKNQRFAVACNSGVEAASGEVVVLLNNDVVPEAGFLKPLVDHFKEKSVFAVGCREKESESGQIFYAGRGLAKFERGLWVHWRAEDQEKGDTFWASGGSMAANRQKWLKLGGMDKLFRPAYWEDIDLSFRARQRGWRILFEPKAVVNHQHETTNLAALGKEAMTIYAYKNQFLFGWKNNDIIKLLKHFFWLPYRLIMTNWRSRGLLGRGFLLALKQLPEVINEKIVGVNAGL